MKTIIIIITLMSKSIAIFNHNLIPIIELRIVFFLT